MSPTSVAVSPASGIPLRSDREELFECLNRIRKTYTAVRDRQPMSFDHRERRGSARVPLRVPVQVTPVIIEAGSIQLVDGDGAVPAESTNLSLRGLGFTHAEPLACTHAAVTFRFPHARNVSLLVDLRWTSLPIDGSYHTGARILGLTELPREALVERRA